MVNLICGLNGTGKTRKMIEMANKSLKEVKGKIVFLEAKSKHIFDLEHEIRYINTKEYGLLNQEQFQGFVCGLIATDYDVELVYIDGLYKIAKIEKDNLRSTIDSLIELSNKFNVKFIMSINYDIEDIPEDLRQIVYVA